MSREPCFERQGLAAEQITDRPRRGERCLSCHPQEV
jgi:hypothetical protein